VKRLVWEDSYKPHSFEELQGILNPEILPALDQDREYGVYYYNRERVLTYQAAEETPRGRVYKKKTKRTQKDRSEWIAIPVPDAGIPREVVESARRALEQNKASSRADGRVWELSAGIFRCGHCGRAMASHATFYRRKDGEKGPLPLLPLPEGRDPQGALPLPQILRGQQARGEGLASGIAVPEEPREAEGGPRRDDPPGRGGVEQGPEKAGRDMGGQDLRGEREEEALPRDGGRGFDGFGELKERLFELDEQKAGAEREIGPSGTRRSASKR
jgi:hypothetical protein